MQPDGSSPNSQLPAIAGFHRAVAENLTPLGVYAASGGKNCHRRFLPSVVNFQQFAQDWA
jgi:hypothetical protein